MTMRLEIRLPDEFERYGQQVQRGLVVVPNNPAFRVRALKLLLEPRLGVPADEQRLIFGGKVMKNEKTLVGQQKI